MTIERAGGSWSHLPTTPIWIDTLETLHSVPGAATRSPSSPSPWLSSTARSWRPWRRSACPCRSTLWRALLDTHRVLTRFRAGYLGKASPVHFFWGSFDLAVTRFSGRLAPPHPGGLPNFPVDVAQEAYSHELTSRGFWPGNRSSQQAVFYAYAYPTREGYSAARVEPDEAFWLDALGEFVLPYEAVASAPDPQATLLRFVESAHAAAAELAGWDRDQLECVVPHGPDWWHSRPRERT